tara:strand:- start:116 stop:460 length:345 start_codon:yes stop_codon:yes gene_type:complete
MRKKFAIIFFVLYLSSCHYYVEEELFPHHFSDCDTTNINDIMILELFDSQCASCHSGNNSSGGLELISLQQIQENIISSLDRINLNEGDLSLMPPGNKLSDCDIKKITIWSDEL